MTFAYLNIEVAHKFLLFRNNVDSLPSSDISMRVSRQTKETTYYVYRKKLFRITCPTYFKMIAIADEATDPDIYQNGFVQRQNSRHCAPEG